MENEYTIEGYSKELLEQCANNVEAFRIAMLASFEFFFQVMLSCEINRDVEVQPFQRTICNKLENIVFNHETNETNNLIINMPPRVGKTTILRYFCAWSFLINMHSKIIYTSFSEKLVDESGESVRDMLQRPIIQHCFPELKVNPNRSGKNNWSLLNGGSMRSSTLKGALLGYGAGVRFTDKYGGLIVIDDPSKAEDFLTEARKEEAIRIFNNTIQSRRNNPRTGIVVIMQRLHPEDLTNHLRKESPEKWDLLVLPALNEDGTSIWESALTADNLREKLASPTTRAEYLTQYQQIPTLVGGNIINSEWFNRYSISSLKNIDPRNAYTFITVDTALKSKTTSDYTAISTWMITDNKLYLLDMIRGRWAFAEIEELIKQRAQEGNIWYKGIEKHRPTSLIIEDHALGCPLIQSLNADPFFRIPIIPLQKKEMKYLRLNRVKQFIEEGYVFLPTDTHAFDEGGMLKQTIIDFMGECESFNSRETHKNDDMVDNMIDALGEFLKYWSPYEKKPQSNYVGNY